MPSLTAIRGRGDQLTVSLDDGSSVLCVPTGQGLWLPTRRASVPTGAGGETAVPGGAAGASPGSVSAPVDDYPWPNAPENDISPLRYSYRDCTDFVAWRINRDNGVTAAPWKYTWGQLRPQGGDGNAIGWRGDWQVLGLKVDLAPAAGLIGWLGSKAGTYGHVCYVQAVASDGTVTVEEYNWLPYHQAYNKDVRHIAPGSAYYPDSFLQMPGH